MATSKDLLIPISAIIPSSSPAEDIAYSSFAVLLTAFYIWLIVRLINRHERWAKRVAIILPIALVMYVFSEAPADALIAKLECPDNLVAIASMFYAPLDWFLNHEHCPDVVLTAATTYYDWWATLIGAPEIQVFL